MTRLHIAAALSGAIAFAILATPAHAEGPQERALDQSLQQMETQDGTQQSAPTYTATPIYTPPSAPVSHAASVPDTVYKPSDDPAPVHSTTPASTPSSTSVKTASHFEGPQERALDNGTDPVYTGRDADPNGDAVVKQLNGGQ